MSLRIRILLATVGPTALALLAFGAAVYLDARATRLADLDRELGARADAIAARVEYDEGWEVEPIPDQVVGPLAGFEVRSGPEVLVASGRLVDRTWTGTIEVESSDEPRRVTVAVARDVRPVQRGLAALLAKLAGIGLALVGLAWALGEWLSRRIVSGEDFQRLQRAWERQIAFTADASHELRTPLATIRASTEIALRRDRSPQEYRETLQDVLSGAERMCELVEGLLVLARSDQPLQLEDVDLVPLVQSAVGACAPAPTASVRTELPEAAPVRGEPRLLRVIVDNLLSNALRHAPEGEVRVRLTRKGGAWTLEVADTGEGIAAEHLPRIFERFYRVEQARGRRRGGAGLGLALVRTIAEQHGGSVEAESALGAGSTFRVRLPERA